MISKYGCSLCKRFGFWWNFATESYDLTIQEMFWTLISIPDSWYKVPSRRSLNSFLVVNVSETQNRMLSAHVQVLKNTNHFLEISDCQIRQDRVQFVASTHNIVCFLNSISHNSNAAIIGVFQYWI